MPALVAGIGLGYYFFTRVDPRLVAASIGFLTLLFTIYWFLFGRRAKPSHMPPSPFLAMLVGIATGFTTFVAHAGGPPVNMYLLKRGLDKSVYTGTNLIVFMLGNLIKLVPYGVLAYAKPSTHGSRRLHSRPRFRLACGLAFFSIISWSRTGSISGVIFCLRALQQSFCSMRCADYSSENFALQNIFCPMPHRDSKIIMHLAQE